MIIPQAPPSIDFTKLFRKLGESLPEHGIQNLAAAFIKAANPIADSIIAGPFNKYTLHNRDHVRKVFHIAGSIISDSTFSTINSAECLLLLYACYLHDMGMALTTKEVEDYLRNPAYLESVENWGEMKIAFQKTRAKLNNASELDRQSVEYELLDLQRAALANYLRPLHATNTRYKSLIAQIKRASGRADIFELNGQSFESELISICESHNLPSTFLGEMLDPYQDRFPRALPLGGYHVNTQFIAALLRLSDILDFDYERTPKSLFESLGIKYSNVPGAQVSIFEWLKHLSVHTIEITKTEVIVSATCHHPIIEAGIREFCQAIECEIQDTIAVLRRNTHEVESKYQIILPPVVRPNLRSEGYIYMDLALKLDEAAIMTLLMGNQLYKSPIVAVRELIQNGIDACLVRKALMPEANYRPQLIVEVMVDKGGTQWLSVTDNGIGMDDYVLKNHFFRVGSSYYKSVEYKRLYQAGALKMPNITSKFGIGFLSTFMIGDEIRIQTKKIYSGGHFSKGKDVLIERMGALAFVQEEDSLPIGTTVIVKLKADKSKVNFDSVRDFLRSNVLRPAVPVSLVTDNETTQLLPGNYYELNIQSKSEIYINKIEVIQLSFDYEKNIGGRIFILLFRGEDGLLSVRKDESLIDITTGSPDKKRVKVNPTYLIRDFEGNRISVNGMKMSFSNLSKLFSFNKSKGAFIYDIDFLSSEDVEFDVSRTKIIDATLSLRTRLREAILDKLNDIGAFDRFDREACRLFRRTIVKGPFDFDVEILKRRKKQIHADEEIENDLLELVKAHVPTDFWPVKLHQQIADKLKITRSEAYEAISRLIINGEVINPNLGMHE